MLFFFCRKHETTTIRHKTIYYFLISTKCLVIFFDCMYAYFFVVFLSFFFLPLHSFNKWADGDIRYCVGDINDQMIFDCVFISFSDFAFFFLFFSTGNVGERSYFFFLFYIHLYWQENVGLHSALACHHKIFSISFPLVLCLI